MRKCTKFWLRLSLASLGMVCCLMTTAQQKPVKSSADKPTLDSRELMAQNMLLFQRSSGGWSKHLDGEKVDYTKKFSAAQEASIKDNYSRNDATIDNGATVKEIRVLTEQYKSTGNKAYLNAVKTGLSYLLKAQYSNGGWPQFFPDTSGYRKHITYNDNAMVNVLNLLEDVSSGTNYTGLVDKSFIDSTKLAVQKGIECLLNTQVKVNGKLTAWCAQHDKNTLLPAKARSYELVSLSGMESAEILEFLIRQKNPSKRIKTSVTAGVEWLKKVQIKGYKFENKPDASLAKGFDRVISKDPQSSIWARFYDVETNEPFFSGRNGDKKKDIKDIEYERRVGYGWYGTWAKKLLEVDYPAWNAANNNNSASSQ